MDANEYSDDEQMVTVVPADFFDELVAVMEEPREVPALQKAMAGLKETVVQVDPELQEKRRAIIARLQERFRDREMLTDEDLYDENGAPK